MSHHFFFSIIISIHKTQLLHTLLTMQVTYAGKTLLNTHSFRIQLFALRATYVYTTNNAILYVTLLVGHTVTIHVPTIRYNKYLHYL